MDVTNFTSQRKLASLFMGGYRYALMTIVFLVLSFLSTFVSAAVLPEEQSEAMYHVYQGGGVDVVGPALLVRKNMKEKYSIYAGYYQDVVSGASPDVIANASEYKDTRDEITIGGNVLFDNMLLNLSYTSGEESDYEASTTAMQLSHEFFSNLTTLTLGFSVGDDTVGRVDNDFSAPLDRRSYLVGVSQIISPTMVLNLSVEGITDEGYLNNPYRYVNILGQAAGQEVYPNTRTSIAYGITGLKSLSRTQSVRLGYRYFDDSWKIKAHTLDALYSHKFGNNWLFDAKYRYYQQSKASFFNSNFDRNYQYMASDKELSGYTSHTLGIGATYTLGSLRYFDRGEVGIAYNFSTNDYDDYVAPTDASGSAYSYSANTFNINFSVWY